MRIKRINPALLHPSVLKRAGGQDLRDAELPPAEKLYVDTLFALIDSLRSPAEMLEAVNVLNPLLEARIRFAEDPERAVRLDEIAAEIFRAARGIRDGRSGMAVDICLDMLQLAMDDARAELSRLA